MRLVKLPSGANEGKFLYVNPDNVTVLYEGDDFTGVVTSDTDLYKVALPMDEVAGRLTMGNQLYDTFIANEEGDSNEND